MVLLIQNTQNRDNAALHAKLDDLILITQGADNDLIESDHLSDEEIERLRKRIDELRKNGKAEGAGRAAEDAVARDRPKTQRRSRRRPK